MGHSWAIQIGLGVTVKWHGDGHPAAGHAQVLKLGHLVDGWSSVDGST
jgi:hypothetical protein